MIEVLSLCLVLYVACCGYDVVIHDHGHNNGKSEGNVERNWPPYHTILMAQEIACPVC